MFRFWLVRLILQTLVKSFSGLVDNILCDLAYDDPLLPIQQQETFEINYSNKTIPQYTTRKNQTRRVLQFYNWTRFVFTKKSFNRTLFEIFKDTFNIRTVPVKGLCNVKSFVLICVLVYQLTVYYNCVTGVENPRIVKRMLCC